jgi:hypothetical protein
MSVVNRQFTFASSNDIPITFASASTGINVVRALNDSIRLAINHRNQPKDEMMAELIKLIEDRYV